MSKPTRVILDDCYQGDPYSHIFRFWTDPAKTTPLDLSANSYRGSVRDNPGASDGQDFAFDIQGAGNNELVLTLTADQTALLGGEQYYDIEETLPGGIVHTIFRGHFYTGLQVTT